MKLSDVSIRRPVFTLMMIGALIVFGVIGYLRVGVDLFPNIEFPFVTITAVYPGADPEAIETKVVTKIEDAVAGVSGIKMLRSMSLENVGQVIIQFVLERNAEEAAQEVRDKVSGVLRDLPKEVEPPVVAKFDMGSVPVLSVVLSSRRPMRELTSIADDFVKPRLQKILGVGGIDLIGGQKREIQIWVKAAELEKHHMTVQDVFATLAAQNLEIPGGRFPQGQEELVVKTKGEVHSAKALGELIVPIPTMGAPVRVRDVAQVVDGSEEARSYSSFNGKTAVSLVVRKQSGTNVTEVARGLRGEIAKLQNDLGEKGVQLSVVADMSTFIERSVGDVKFDLVFGALLAVVIILLFLRNLRTTLISAVAIPTSVIATFAFVYFMKFTLNWMTLLALSLSIGILIDDAIVVIENIYRHIEEGMGRTEAAHFATDEIGLAVLATTFSIVAVFIPVAFMKGMVGRFFYEFGVTASVAVLISLFVSFTLTPMLSSRFVRIPERQNPLFRGIERILVGLDRAYRATLASALRHRLVVIFIAIVALAGSFYLARFLKQEFMPPMDRSEFNVMVQLPTGKSLVTTRRFAESLAREIRLAPGVQQTLVTVGGGVEQKVNEAKFYVKIVGTSERAFTQHQFMDYLRKRFARHRGAIISVEDLNMVGASGMRNQVIQLNVKGPDLEAIEAQSRKIMTEMRKLPGVVDVDYSYRAGKPELAITVDRNKAATLGVPVASIATTVRALMGGDKATQLRESGSLYDVRVRLQAQDRIEPEDLTRLQVRSSMGQLIDLGNVISVKRGSGPTQIDRQDRQRQVTIFANLVNRPLGDALTDIGRITKRILPAGFSHSFSGMGEVMGESYTELIFALLLAIIIVYMILAAQFESFVHPFTIMLSLPLSLVGAFGGLLVFGAPMSIIGMIGVIMLMGLVTKNAILLVDYTNTLRSRGLGRTEALLAAGPVRLRPILMTTAAMVFGMLPVAIGLGEGAELRSPMAVCVIGGLLTSTMLTLIVVPVVYSLVDAASERLWGKKAALVEAQAATAADGHVAHENGVRTASAEGDLEGLAEKVLHRSAVHATDPSQIPE
jgi:hydrophobic/amphiphilic exporter-1 (mainly G- bacteria), HAE1 family